MNRDIPKLCVCIAMLYIKMYIKMYVHEKVQFGIIDRRANYDC